jgi:hypothetical protein
MIALVCSSEAHRFAVRAGIPAAMPVLIVEDDGFGTGANDDFGWRFWYSGTYPFGATLGTATINVQSFYKNTWDNVRSAYFRIQFN